MDYYKINLNKLEDPRIARRKARGEILAYCLLLAGSMVLFVTLCVFNARLNGKRAHFLKVRDKIQSEINILEKSKDFVSEAEVRKLSQLNRKRIFWTGKLENLSRLTGGNIAITRVKFNGKKLLIAGITKSSSKTNHFADVSEFIKKLRGDPVFNTDFNKILFESSKRDHFDNQEIVQFEILCHREGPG